MNNELYHFGVKGMRWGEWNEETRARYLGRRKSSENVKDLSDDELRRRVARAGLESQYNKMNTDNTGKNAVNGLNQIANDMSNISNRLKTGRRIRYKPIDLSKMTDQELRDAINRRNLEEDYTRKFGERVKTGRDYIIDLFDFLSPGLSMSASALAIALSIKALKG